MQLRKGISEGSISASASIAGASREVQLRGERSLQGISLPMNADLNEDGQAGEDTNSDRSSVEEEIPSGRGGPVASVTNGPVCWDEVDLEDIERTALAIARNAVPSNSENAEVASRMAAQAAALEVDQHDILGLGRIDTQNCSLTRSGDAAAMSSPQRLHAASPPAGGAAAAQGRRSLYGVQHTAAATGVNLQRNPDAFLSKRAAKAGSTVSSLRAKIMPSSESFDPEAYLGFMHSDTRVDDLRMGRLNLQRDLSERNTQLQSLVKDNFDRFISCNNTIEDIHLRLRSNESGATGTRYVAEAMQEVQQATQDAFGPMLERQNEVHSVKGVLAMLQRYESLFRLPSRIRAATERGDFEAVIAEYRKAKGLMNSLAKSSPVWQNLFLQVDKGVEGMVKQLQDVLKDTRTTAADAAAPMRLLLQLQEDGAAAAQKLDPVKLYLDSQHKYLERLMELCSEEASSRVDAAQLAQSSTAIPNASRSADVDGLHRQLSDIQGSHLSGLARFKGRGAVSDSSRTPGSQGAAAAGPKLSPSAAARVSLISKLVAVLVRHLPDLWHAPSEQVAAVAAAVPSAASSRGGSLVEAATISISAIVSAVVATFTAKAGEAIGLLAREEGAAGTRALSAAVYDLSLAALALKEEAAPPVAIAAVQGLLERASLDATGRVATEMVANAAALGDLADWDAVPHQQLEGDPVSVIPGLLEAAVVSGAAQLQEIAAECARAGVNAAAACAPQLRSGFFQAFTVFAVAIDRVSAGVVQSSKAAPSATDQKLLLLLCSCTHVRTITVPDLSQRFRQLLTADSAAGVAAAESATAGCCADVCHVEGQLLAAYSASKVATLDDALQEYFQGDGTLWSALPAPDGLRDAAAELLSALTVVEAEVRHSATAVRSQVMGDLLHHLLSRFAEFTGNQHTMISKGGALQLMLELAFFKEALATLLQPAIASMFGEAHRVLAARFSAGAATGGVAGTELLAEWVQPDVTEANTASALEHAVKSHLAVMRQELRLNMACFGALSVV